ncbi:hypothetical protein [Psychrobacter sp. FME5]|uniref:hypothetical protein n=1 Tax=Psychrobacter sp. FME5 TaxID=2487706 RepID=UPI0021F0CF31|nr:hypothetical protein [Psychrobacter sp. FME5]
MTIATTDIHILLSGGDHLTHSSVNQRIVTDIACVCCTIDQREWCGLMSLGLLFLCDSLKLRFNRVMVIDLSAKSCCQLR